MFLSLWRRVAKVKFFQFLSRRNAGPKRQIPAGQRVYAIGDVHGRLDLLRDLLAQIEADDQQREPAETTVILLGDLIDRGPQSAETIEYLRSDRPSFATFRFLMGNHEEAMLRSLVEDADPREIGWLSFGGLQTLTSYGVPAQALDLAGPELSAELRRHVPPQHLAFIISFENMIRIGDYVFVHAGIRPNVTLEEQDEEDLRWIRAPFLNDDSDHGFMVVHGHTITEEPAFRANRLGIDTGAYSSGRLTAIGLQDNERWVLRAVD
jgi:serine/threonine protein phosphatase 1